MLFDLFSLFLLCFVFGVTVCCFALKFVVVCCWCALFPDCVLMIVFAIAVACCVC